jgi:hypothetical protein
MEPEVSLPQLQMPATCPYPEPARSIHTPTPYFLKIHFNFIYPSTPGSPKWSLSISFPNRNSVYASPMPHMSYMSRPSHSSRFFALTILDEEQTSLSSSIIIIICIIGKNICTPFIRVCWNWCIFYLLNAHADFNLLGLEIKYTCSCCVIYENNFPLMADTMI